MGLLAQAADSVFCFLAEPFVLSVFKPPQHSSALLAVPQREYNSIGTVLTVSLDTKLEEVSADLSLSMVLSCNQSWTIFVSFGSPRLPDPSLSLEDTAATPRTRAEPRGAGTEPHSSSWGF